MELASAACANQNLWLSARAEGLGLGWVLLFEPVALAALLGLPHGAEPLALLCLCPVHEFDTEPMLQQQKWAARESLASLVDDNCCGELSNLFDNQKDANGS